MAKRPLAIIHGWSDSYRSFRRLARILTEEGIAGESNVHHVKLGNYISMDDEVTYDDISTALSIAWDDMGLPRTSRSVDVVVHSTGALVVRDWITREFPDGVTPVRHLLMLAPANFGSALAHKGRAFMGRVIKGFSSPKLFQTGEKILKGLELASPFTWDLAFKDRFGTVDYYGPGGILCTTLVGNTGYDGISAAANEDGSDGTVRVSTANLNCVVLDLDFHTDPLKPDWDAWHSAGKTAFGVMDGENHSTVAAKDRGPRNKKTLEFIKAALTVSDAGFKGFCKRLDDHNDEVMARRHAEKDKYRYGYQNTVFFLTDQFENHIQDYFLEFFVEDKNKNWFTEMFQRDVIRTVHAYADDKSYRSFLVDCTTLRAHVDEIEDELRIRLTALPEFATNKNVGYRTFAWDDMESLRLPPDLVKAMFRENRTLLVRIRLRREQSEKVFRFRPC